MQKKNDFFISCKECRIENPRSFYGCFYLGPFKPSQSLTVANALRRTLLSELNGVAISSVYIEGADHEYSTLPGIRDSVLDILLNLKEIIFKTVSFNNGPLIGYLQASGPGEIRASDLKLPTSIQAVDPNQYVATLSHDGHLNLKFVISEGQNYYLQTPKILQQTSFFEKISNKVPLCVDPVFMPVNKVNYTIESIPYEFMIDLPSSKINNETNHEFLNMQQYNNSFSKKDYHVVILEVWTNGSIHPREAVTEALKHLLLLFSSLNKMNLIYQSSSKKILKNKINSPASSY